MLSLKQYLQDAEAKHTAIGHFNFSDLTGLRAIFESARALMLPVIVGTSEGERDFVGVREAAALVRHLRETYDFPIFINADHTHSLEKAREAAEAGYDAILFDAGKLPFEENITKTKEVVAFVKSKNPGILVEGELGYIGGSSQILKEMPKEAAVDPRQFTKPEEAKRFVAETKVDLLAPAVGNLHGMFANVPNPKLDIGRIRDIRFAVNAPLVLHGGSGTDDNDFSAAIKAGIAVVHINTEIRLAWRKGIEEGLAKNPDEVAPYKLLEPSLSGMEKLITARLKLFAGLV